MALPVYSLRIFAHASLVTSAGTVGPVVPAGFVYVLRDVDVFEETGAQGVTLSVVNPLGGYLTVFLTGSTLQSRVQQWRGRQVYHPGEQVGFFAGSGQWAIMASGYQLTLP